MIYIEIILCHICEMQSLFYPKLFLFSNNESFINLQTGDIKVINITHFYFLPTKL